MSELLERASAQLASGASQGPRRACWLARAALEQAVVGLLADVGIDAPKASDRARVTCLEGAYVDDRALVDRVHYVWSRLNEHCHQHAYELAPTHSEAERLVGLVEHIESSLGSPD